MTARDIAGIFRARAGIAVLGCAAILLAGCGTSGSTASEVSTPATDTPVVRGDVGSPAEDSASKISASVTGAGQVQVSWQQANVVSSAKKLVGYEVQVATGVDGPWSGAGSGCAKALTKSSTATTCTATGLADGTYSFRVAALKSNVATGAETTGEFSAGSAVVTLLSLAAPGAPATPTGVAGDGKVTVTVAAGTGSEPTSFTVSGSSSSASAPAGTCTVTGASGSCDVTGLANGSPYVFTATATNSVGTSAASAASAPVTPAGVPGRPASVTLTPRVASVLLSWSAPVSNGGSAITGYSVQVGTSATGSFSDATGCEGAASSTALTCTATGLTSGSMYWFKVAAKNAVGTGGDFLSGATPLAGSVPGVPRSVTATSGSASAVVSWMAPSSNGGSAVTGYSVQVATSSTGSFADAAGCVAAASSTVLTCTATGLTNGSTYWFKVAAKNAVGTSASASAVSVTPSAPVPGTPTSVTATSGSASAVVSWMAPASNGGSAISGYSVQVATSSTGSFADAAGCVAAGSSTALSCTATGLTNGSTYWFKVAAKNAAGVGAYASAVSVWLPLYSIGSTGPGGGVIFYTSAAAFTSTGSACGTNCHYLEAQRTDLGQLAWCSGPSYQYKVVGAGGNEVGNGFRNTDVGMRASTCSGGAGFTARASTSGGMSDWYVPASDELIALYSQRAIVGGFTTRGYADYWSSSQGKGVDGGIGMEALAGDFSSGTGMSANKSGLKRVRLIRAL